MSLRVGLIALVLSAGCAGGPSSAVTATERFEDRWRALTVDADRMERSTVRNAFIFTGRVVARQNKTVQHADRLEVFLNDAHDSTARMVATGNVRVRTRDCLTATAQRAVYYEPEQQLVLSRDVRVSHGDTVVSDERFVIELARVPWTKTRCAN